MKMQAVLSVAMLCLASLGEAEPSMPGKVSEWLPPKVWMSTIWREPAEETIRLCAEQGVDVVEVPTWGSELCGRLLPLLRKYNVKGFTSGDDTSMDVRGVVRHGRPCERAVMTGGAYRGLAIDRTLFSFTAAPYEIVIEPPVYSKGQPYTRRTKGADGKDAVTRSGHYFGSFRPTGKAEIVVPERLFDGSPHVRVIPCEVLPARPDAKPEKDTAAGLGGPEIENRRLVRLKFDLSDCKGMMLDKVGIAVYWESDPDGKTWKNGKGQLSVFSKLTADAARAEGKMRATHWANANGGVFPADDIIAIRFGDECFNLTGWGDCPAASFPVWGFSPSGRAAFAAAAPGLVQPRTWGYPEIYGAEAYGHALYEFHRGCANLVRAFAEGVHSVSPAVKVFRNTTRGDAWSEQNDHDGSGQELLARELDFVHIDPYPVAKTYLADRIPFDMGYMSGFARRFGKPIIPWMQGHSYAPSGLGNITPADMKRMWNQHLKFAPDGMMWLGFNLKPGKTDTEMTFPKGSPESWAYAKELFAEVHAAGRATCPDATGRAACPHAAAKPIATLAVLRPYSVRAVCCAQGGWTSWRNPADRILAEYVKAWSLDHGLLYDVFELPPKMDAAERAALAEELKRYPHVVSTCPYPGARVIGAGTEGRVMKLNEIAALRKKFATEIAELKARESAVFNVRDFGAVGDGVAKDTAAVQRAIDAANAAGGGEVLLPKGTYLCGSVFLKSGVDFHLAEGAVLKGSPDPADYNAADVAPQNSGRLGKGDNTSGGHLLLCIEQKNVTLRGPGKIDGNVGAFLKMPDGSHPKNKLMIPWRPSQMVWFVESRNIAVRDIELADAPYWSCFIYGCEDVAVVNARIHTVRNPHTYNGDGLDIDSSRRVRVTGCNISTADDSITLRADGARLKAAHGHAGRVTLPDCADVVVSNCTLSSDCNAIRLGVGNGHIRDCSFTDIRIENTRYAVNAVGAWSRPDHGVDISNVSFTDMTLEAKGFCKFYYKHATHSVFDGITFRHVRGKVRESSIFDDTPARPFRNLRFEDVRLEGETSKRIHDKIASRTVEDFNDDWEFSRDERAWRAVEIPHDWAIEGPFDPEGDAHTGKLPWKGVGWYRKTVVLDAAPKGRRVFLDFDGVMCDGTAYVNGQPCGRQMYGYLGFRADATPYLYKGTNTIVVKADTTKLMSRWYPGAGMYRRVRKIETDDIYLDERDIVLTTPDVSAERATVRVAGAVTSRLNTDAAATVAVTIKNPSGETVATGRTDVVVRSCGKGTFGLALTVEKPALWEMTCPAALYTTEVEVTSGDKEDAVAFKTGLRTFRFDAKEGFFLNGRHVQLKGVCLHADLGILGMAYNRSAMRRQLAIMRDMGVNALRTSHNPPSPETLELCDEMGIFVWDECFDKWNATCGRGDEPLEEFVGARLAEFVRRDRNHPCVFVWSIGNEIPNGGGFAPGQEIWNMPSTIGTTAERCARFRSAVLAEDATRPVGIGSCFPKAATEGHYASLDITGWNYNQLYGEMHRLYPDKPLIYSESASAFSDYGYYAPVPPTNKTDYGVADFSVDSYDRNAAAWSDIPDREFERMERDRFIAGEFVWTGIDYLGEPSPYVGKRVCGVPLSPRDRARSSYFGICDLLCFPKDRTYLYRSYWNKEAFTLHIVPDHWTFHERAGQKMPIYVYSSADEVELFLNGVSLGRRRKDPSATMANGYYAGMPRYRLIWNDVEWKPGTLKAVAFDANGAILGEETLRTASAATSVVLSPESSVLPADRNELVFVKVTLADANGTSVPRDNRRVFFAVEGPGQIVSVGNSNPRGLDSFKDVTSHPLHNGRAGLAIRRTGPGEVRLTAAADGLVSAVATFVPVEQGCP